MERFTLTDAQWEKMAPFCHGKPTDPGRTGGDTRLVTESVLWSARTGSPWRDLPELFGHWRGSDTTRWVLHQWIKGVEVGGLIADKAFG